ncbi:conserved hypothetical protein [uncultured Desulfobacterium sp.]|uniref:Uncharacterized protein n=1 Tax=uncultured Desulfobacterium sp. TaxID=201089 RepID=A0A445MZD5_9BACT|nr:conserved hypothetical protein [uncultured Desulfobacterium sp.]
MGLLKKIAETNFVRKAIAEKADLEVFKKRPGPKVISGIFIIVFSYIIGWPAVGALGIISYYLDKPLIVIIGGPITYGLSHFVFILGAYLAGAQYSKAFLLWATRIAVERMMKSGNDTS